MKKLNVNVNGNKKLVNNENVRFIIWNIPACKTCPFATENCKAACYARKAERVYPQVLPCRENNFTESLKPDFVENMIFTIEKELNSKKFRGKKAFFRIHESGDFYNMEYAKKWIEICKHFENDNRIVFLAYTKSIIYFVKSGYNTPEFPKNLIIRSSIWNDTKPENVEMTEKYNFPIYTAATPEEIETATINGEKIFICDCVDCGNCKACYFNDIKNIIVKIH